MFAPVFIIFSDKFLTLSVRKVFVKYFGRLKLLDGFIFGQMLFLNIQNRYKIVVICRRFSFFQKRHKPPEGNQSAEENERRPHQNDE